MVEYYSFIAIGFIILCIMIAVVVYLFITMGFVEGPERLDAGSEKNLAQQRRYKQQDIEAQNPKRK